MSKKTTAASTETSTTFGKDQITQLIYQVLETELGGIEIYRTALRCVSNDDLREEWEKYLKQTEEHAKRARALCEEVGIDPEAETPGRQVIRHIGESLVRAMEMALESDPDGAQIVAAECVTLAETKDHLNWSLVGKAVLVAGEHQDSLLEAYEKTEDQEDEHLYHSQGWARELWLEALGLAAVLPPPEEEQHVKTAIGAAKVQQNRKKELSKEKGRAPKEKEQEAG